MKIKTVGSICSGIEAASFAWNEFGFSFSWFSEIAKFPSLVLKEKYPTIPNLGDMNGIPEKIKNNEIDLPDLICGGTPCQAFSLAGEKNGLNDDRGNLTLKFVDIVESNDLEREKLGKEKSVVFWENVEGVLKDKTNAFGCLVSSLAGIDEVLEVKKWPNAGIVRGPKRNVAWRLLDAKYFGLPQQRKRLYLLSGGTDFFPENILFEKHNNAIDEYPDFPLVFEKEGCKFEVFRNYTDCLYAAYGTKWNGNAAAYNGSLFVVQNEKIRRLSPLECERLMGFPDNYTDIKGSTNTTRYQAIGNSWAVPVVKWIGKRLVNSESKTSIVDIDDLNFSSLIVKLKDGIFINCKDGIISSINCSTIPEKCTFADMSKIVSSDVSEKIYISPVGCYGIIRRKNERNIRINKRLEEVLLSISSKMDLQEIEQRSRIQKRGKLSDKIEIIDELKDKEKTSCQTFDNVTAV
ncbi:MAG: DNA cytosine methyltransferase [Bacilli bacterium]